MSRKPAHASGREIFRSTNIPFESVPGQSRLFLDFETDSQAISAYYPNKFRDVSEFCDQVLARYEIDRSELTDVLLKANRDLGISGKTIDNIERLRSDRSVAVITGQQAGLFSGPIYTIYKALSAIKYAEYLCSEGLDAVPVFWVASEDHDFQEIRKTSIIDRGGKLARIEVDALRRSEFEPVGLTIVPNEIEGVLDRLFEMLGESERSESIASIVRDCYKPGTDFSSAFTRLLSKLLADYGVVFVSPLNKDVRALCTPIYKRAIKRAREIGTRLRERGRELEDSGFHTQVLVNDGYFPFFYIDENGRRNSLKVIEDGSGIGSTDGKYEFTVEELVQIASETPDSLSPNALMRPVVQDYLFPTAGYIGGSAEIAYFGQNSSIYEVLDRPITPIHHRASATVIEPKHRRTMQKYEIELVNLFEGIESIQSRVVEQFLSPEIGGSFENAESTIRKLLSELDSELQNIDPTLSESLAKRKSKILWHVESLRRKYHRAATRNNDVLEKRISSLFENVVPNGGLQERNLNVLYFLNLYGSEFIDWVYESIEPKGKGHRILSL